jgi:hypothetical protein
MISTGLLETRRELEQVYTKKELCVKLVIYKNRLKGIRQYYINKCLYEKQVRMLSTVETLAKKLITIFSASPSNFRTSLFPVPSV